MHSRLFLALAAALCFASGVAAKPNPATLLDLQIKPSPAAQTLPSAIQALVANKTARLSSSNSSALASLLNSKLHPSPTPSPAAPSCEAPSDPAYTSQFNAADQTIIECTGVPLVSISSFAMGQCGSRTTADPRVFGPPAWRAFHIFAQNYPTQPTATVKAGCELFIAGIAYMLPCPHCGYDFLEFIKVNDLYENTDPFNPACKGSQAYNMPCQGPATACRNQANLINFFLRAHYNVDTLTKPCKKLWTPSMAAAAYGQVEDFCANNIVFGTKQLCKSVGETGCVVV